MLKPMVLKGEIHFFLQLISSTNIFILVLLIILGIFPGFTTFKKPYFSASAIELESYALGIINKCADSKYRHYCYEEELPKLIHKKLSMEESFVVLSIIQEKDKSYIFCHRLGHKLTAKEVSRDPSKWREVFARSPSNICSNGAMHGVFQERFGTEVLNKSQIGELLLEIKNICKGRDDWNPTEVDKVSCFHGLGHLFMYVTNDNTDESVQLCERQVQKKDRLEYLLFCFDGVFMSVYQAFDPEYGALILANRPKKEDVPNFCSKFNGKARASCWMESWILAKDEIVTAGGLVRFCNSPLLEEEAERQRCFSSRILMTSALLNFDGSKIIEFCKYLPRERVGKCFGDAASRIIVNNSSNVEKAIDLCSKVGNKKDSEECLSILAAFSVDNFQPKSKELINICTKFPESFKVRCLQKAY